MRIMGRENVPDPSVQPVLFYMNHSSWWDPIAGVVLTDELFPGCRGFGPMDAEMLKKYAFMERIGLFPVERDSARGAAGFLKTSRDILSSPKHVIGLTPQGEFVDARERPIKFKPGIAHLARDIGQLSLLPIAIELVFWNEKKPELLINIGPPVDTSHEPGHSIEKWNTLLQTRLEDAMDELAAVAKLRDGSPFETLIGGETGISPVYDLGRRVKALFTGKKFTASHGEDT